MAYLLHNGSTSYKNLEVEKQTWVEKNN